MELWYHVLNCLDPFKKGVVFMWLSLCCSRVRAKSKLSCGREARRGVPCGCFRTSSCSLTACTRKKSFWLTCLFTHLLSLYRALRRDRKCKYEPRIMFQCVLGSYLPGWAIIGHIKASCIFCSLLILLPPTNLTMFCWILLLTQWSIVSAVFAGWIWCRSNQFKSQFEF